MAQKTKTAIPNRPVTITLSNKAGLPMPRRPETITVQIPWDLAIDDETVQAEKPQDA
jgi:hypothetical protein